MGIRGLTTQIAPYGEPVTYTSRLPSDTTTYVDVIIDGPSFSYLIHSKCLATKINARNAFDALPTYAELGEAAVTWLDELERFGLRIKHIYFDGFLPASKTSTRHERLEKNLLKLRTFRANNVNIAWSGSNNRTAKHPNADGTTHVPSRLTGLGAAPFLVPAVLDALNNSRYARVTSVVPCEAEVACVDDREPSDIILTNDSDLIILAPVGKVMFFNELHFGSKLSFHDTLTGVQYSRLDISSKLNCGDLLKMAFYMERDIHCGIKECAKQASQLGFPNDNVKAKYSAFKDSYASAAQHSAFGSFTEVRKPYRNLQRQLPRLDARTCEVVQLWLSELDTKDFPIRSASMLPEDSVRKPIIMFLSFLLDDPTRASAWRASSDIRLTACSILALYGSTFKMTEYDRRGERMVTVDIALVKPQGVEDRCSDLANAIEETVFTSDKDQHIDSWRLFLLKSVLAAVATSGSSMPGREVVTHFVDAAPSAYSWPDIHLSAQVEGYYYSLRILQQILSIYLCGDIPLHPHLDHRVFEHLYKVLQGMPAIKDIFTRSGAGFTLEGSIRRELELHLIELYDRNDAGGDDTDGQGFEVQKSKNKKRKRAKDGLSQPAGSTMKAPQNMFDLLGQE